MRRLLLLAALGAALGAGRPSLAADGPVPAVGRDDKCPVCGMFVSRYPDWKAAVVFRDGKVAWFDGAKDLFKFLEDPSRHIPGRKAGDVDRVLVSDYYAVTLVDAREAFFVVGSDVMGPMGRELVPFARRQDADEFLRDHRGKRVLRFQDVNRGVLQGLE